MSNTSVIKMYAACIRSAGSKHPQTGVRYGGSYYPAMTLNGKALPAKWEGNFFVNHLGFTDSQGNVHEPSNDMIRVTAWNSRNAAAGKGLADTFAKLIGVGKEICCDLRLKQYMKRVMVGGKPVMDDQGQPLTYYAYNFTVIGDILWGNDSANLIASEIKEWADFKQPSFISRPPLWNVPNTEDAATWKAIMGIRSAHIWDGTGTYGYARVIIPDGAVLTNTAQPAIVQPQAIAVPAPVMQQTIAPAPTLAAPAAMDANTFALFTQFMAAQGITPGGAVPQPGRVAIGALPTSGVTMPVSAAAATMVNTPI